MQCTNKAYPTSWSKDKQFSKTSYNLKCVPCARAAQQIEGVRRVRGHVSQPRGRGLLLCHFRNQHHCHRARHTHPPLLPPFARSSIEAIQTDMMARGSVVAAFTVYSGSWWWGNSAPCRSPLFAERSRPTARQRTPVPLSDFR
jgi:hypothetical protein